MPCKAFSVRCFNRAIVENEVNQVRSGSLSVDFALPEDNWDLESESSGLSSYSDDDETDEMYSNDMNGYLKAMDQELRSTNVPQTAMDEAIRKVSSAWSVRRVKSI